jgi:hypothetical protein
MDIQPVITRIKQAPRTPRLTQKKMGEVEEEEEGKGETFVLS